MAARWQRRGFSENIREGQDGVLVGQTGPLSAPPPYQVVRAFRRLLSQSGSISGTLDNSRSV